MKYNVDVVTLTWNERKLIPFAVDYWKKFARHVYVYDNESDDGTVEYLSQFDWITVRPFSTNGELDDVILQGIKNEEWKFLPDSPDFIVVCDMDELHYCDDWDKLLDHMKENNIACATADWYAFACDEFPDYESVSRDGKLLHEAYPNIVRASSKVTLFTPYLVKEMHWSPGCHNCRPTIVEESKMADLSSMGLYVLHADKFFGLAYLLDRTHTLRGRRCDYNIKRGFGIHYTLTDEQLTVEYDRRLKVAMNFNDIQYAKES